MKIVTALAGMWIRLAKLLRQDRTKMPKSLSDHAARDIGLTKAELERHRFVWPSESNDRPLL